MAASQDLTNMENRKSHIQQKEEDVEEVKDIMLGNANKINERDDNLADLEVRREKLLKAIKRFNKTMPQVEQQYRPENQKKHILICVGVVVTIGVILGYKIYFIIKWYGK